MKNISQKTVSILISCVLVLLYTYIKTEKNEKNEVYDQKPKELNTLKESYCYASEEEKEFAIAYKNGFI